VFDLRWDTSVFVHPEPTPAWIFADFTNMVRLKSRWLLFEISYPSDTSSTIPFSAPSQNVTSKLLLDILRQQIAYNFGDQGSGLVAASLSVRYFSAATSTGIIRIGRDHYRMVWAALTFVRDIAGRECVISVRRVSGTVKKAEEEILRRDKLALRKVKSGKIQKVST
jgi:ribonuclease P/MRP protein subunit POP5